MDHHLTLLLQVDCYSLKVLDGYFPPNYFLGLYIDDCCRSDKHDAFLLPIVVVELKYALFVLKLLAIESLEDIRIIFRTNI